MTADRVAEQRRVAALRAIPLTTVLTYRGAERDRSDRAKWHTERGALSVTGEKFWNWTRQRGGGGAIDLVMHLADVSYRPARQWLEQHLGNGLAADVHRQALPSRSIDPHAPKPSDHLVATQSTPLTSALLTSALPTSALPTSALPTSRRSNSHRDRSSRPLVLPRRDDRRLSVVRDYLERRRGLPSHRLDPLIASGKLYADSRSNAVFLLVSGRAEKPVGAELRGTGPRTWRGLAPGTNKDAGYFWTGPKGSRRIVLCESAIDALSCAVLFPDRICLSTSGVRSNPAWLSGLTSDGYEIVCGFDADEAGDRMSVEMERHYPSIHRLRPWSHDWNDVLMETPAQHHPCLRINGPIY
jgi:hypothetical protein